MGKKRRTRKQKERSATRFVREVNVLPQSSVVSGNGVFGFKSETTSVDRPGISRAEAGILAELPEIRKDLLKTVVVIVLALASEIVVYLSLRQGYFPWRL